MIFHDFEVFKYNWLICIIDTDAKTRYHIWDNPDALRRLYESHSNDIWVGYNNKHYDQYIFKGILLDMDPYDISDFIIRRGQEGWAYSKSFRDIPMINYDVMPNPPVGLKTLEAFMGVNIKETDVPFNIDRPLTEEEKRQTEGYCYCDVENTASVFMRTIDRFNSMLTIVKEFNLPFSCVGDSEARVTAKVMGCKRVDYNDEFDFEFIPCLQLKKYKFVQEWFDQHRSPEAYKEKLVVDVAGVPHTFAFGGVHGAPDEPVHYTAKDGAGYHVDVNNYYPSFLIAHGRITRAATNDNYQLVYKIRKQLKAKQQAAKDKVEKKKYKNMQLPYKKILNALSGAMKDKTSQAYDPRMNNEMCINGQLMLLDLIEHLEVIPGFKLVQSNTDGLIVWIPDTDEAFEMLDDICYEWESRCSTDLCEIGLALDCIQEIIQKDVNNYIWIDAEGGVERIGAYVKELSDLDADLPIVNEALVNLFTKKIPLADTIYGCNEVKKFQKIVKLSDKYDHVGHEYGNPEQGKGKNLLVYGKVKRYDYKCYRVFASSDIRDGRLLKFKPGKKGEKFANTPDHCFIINDVVNGAEMPEKLDKSWYLRLAEKRAREYGYV